MQFAQAVEFFLQACRVGEEVVVVADEEGDAGRVAGLDAQAGAGAHRLQKCVGHLQRADLAAFRLDENRLGESQPLQHGEEAALEHFLRGLEFVRQAAQYRALVCRQGFQVEHLRALCGEGFEQAALAAAGGASDDAIGVATRQIRQFCDDVAAVGLVAAFQRAGVPADLMQHVRHGAAALAAAPAIDQRAPAARLVEKARLDVPGDVARNQRRPDLLGGEGRVLLVERADAGALLVGEHRAIDRAGHVVFGEFGGRAHVYDLVKFVRLCYVGNACRFHSCSWLSN